MDKTSEKIVHCSDCEYFKQFKDAKGYGECRSKHTFDGAFKSSDYCSYGKLKTRESSWT